MMNGFQVLLSVSYKVVGPRGDDGAVLLEPVTVLFPVSLGVHPAWGVLRTHPLHQR